MQAEGGGGAGTAAAAAPKSSLLPAAAEPSVTPGEPSATRSSNKSAALLAGDGPAPPGCRHHHRWRGCAILAAAAAAAAPCPGSSGLLEEQHPSRRFPPPQTDPRLGGQAVSLVAAGEASKESQCVLAVASPTYRVQQRNGGGVGGLWPRGRLLWSRGQFRFVLVIHIRAGTNRRRRRTVRPSNMHDGTRGCELQIAVGAPVTSAGAPAWRPALALHAGPLGNVVHVMGQCPPSCAVCPGRPPCTRRLTQVRAAWCGGKPSDPPPPIHRLPRLEPAGARVRVHAAYWGGASRCATM